MSGNEKPDVAELLEELYAQSQRAAEMLLAEQADRAEALEELAEQQSEALAKWLAEQDATG